MVAAFLLALYWWVVPLTSKLQGWPRTVEEEVAEEFRRVVNEFLEKGIRNLGLRLPDQAFLSR